MKVVIPWMLGLVLGAGGPLTASGLAQQVTAQRLSDGSPLRRQAALAVEDVPVATALFRLSESSGVIIVFSPSLVGEVARRVDCACGGVTVAEALDRILRSTDFVYSELRGQVVITLRGVPSREPAVQTASMSHTSFQLLDASLGTRSMAAAVETPTLDGRQQAEIAGTVVDTRSNPLEGARVAVAGGPEVTTDAKGRFRIGNLTDGQVTVRVARIGYQPLTQTVRVGEQNLRLVLTEMAVNLNEVVVTGTVGELQRRALGNSLAKIQASEGLEKGASPDISGLINGRAPGVVIVPGTGIAGSGARINIRGRSSLTLSGEPLIYVDGVRVNNDVATGPAVQSFSSGVISRLNDISPEEIESIEIIKGPAAATLYGTEASNGVIQIITKRGRSGDRATVGVRVRQGTSWLGHLNSLAEPHTVYRRDPTTGQVMSMNLIQNLLAAGQSPFRTGHLQGYGADIAGGSDALQYFAALNLDDDQGVNPDNDAKRYGGRLNLSFTPHRTLNVRTNMGITVGDVALPQDFAVWFGMLYSPPKTTTSPQDAFFYPPPDIARRAVNQSQHFTRFIGSVALNHNPVSWFSQRLNLGLDLTGEDNKSLTGYMDAELRKWYTGVTVLGSKVRSRRDISMYTLDYSGTFSLPFTKGLRSNTSFGGQLYRRRTELLSATGREFPASGVTVLAATGTTFGSDDFLENTTVGLFAQQQFAWRDRVFLTGAIRGDDNSAFGRDYEFVVYPKASATWVISEEPFWHLGFVNALKLRAAYGQSGQQPETFAALRAYEPVPTPTGGSAVSPSFLGNAALAPERGEEIEVGLEAGLFNQRLGIDFTFYTARTKDAILVKGVAPSTGFSGSQFINAGEIRNTGVELALKVRPVTSQRVDWDLSFNLSRNSNEILSLGEQTAIPEAIGSLVNLWNRVGYPVGSWFWRKPVSASLDANGRAVNVMCDGGPEGGHQPMPCAQAPLVFYGPGTPKYEGSVSSTLRLFQKLQLYALLDFKTGFYASDFVNDVQCVLSLCRAQAEPTAVAPLKVAQLQDPSLGRPSFIADQSYAKLREMSLTYTLPDRWAGLLGARLGAITVAARNLLTWTGWKGLDPENSMLNYEARLQDARIGYVNTPQPVQFIATLRLTR